MRDPSEKNFREEYYEEYMNIMLIKRPSQAKNERMTRIFMKKEVE